MAYYLKKTTIKGRTYLSIDESFYSHKKKGTAHKCYRLLGSVETLKASGTEDPIAFYQKEVDALNQERKRKGAKKIGSECGEAGKHLIFIDKEGNKASAKLNRDAVDNDLRLAGYNLLVTSELAMSDKDIYDVCHNLWLIEKSFRIMKSDLNARPVFLQKEETIKGHFLICYLAVLLERLLQFKVLKNKASSSEIFRFFKGFKVVKAKEALNKYVHTIHRCIFRPDCVKNS